MAADTAVDEKPPGKAVREGISLPHPTRRNIVWWTIQMLLRIVFTLRFRYRAQGMEWLPKSGGGLMLVNHQSNLDPLFVGLPLSRPVSFIARDTLFPIPFIGWVLRKTYVMPINRDAASSASIRGAVDRMQHGFFVGVFPEGTRTRDGKLGEIKPGFVAIAKRAKVPVYPVGISGGNEAMPRGSIWLHRKRVSVVFGEPLSVEEVAELCQRGRQEEFVQLVSERMQACIDKADAWRDRQGKTG